MRCWEFCVVALNPRSLIVYNCIPPNAPQCITPQTSRVSVASPLQRFYVPRLTYSTLRNLQQRIIESVAISLCYKSHNWDPQLEANQREKATLVGLMQFKESLQITNNILNIPITVSGIHSHSKASKCVVVHNLPSSRGTMTKAFTLQVPKKRQHILASNQSGQTTNTTNHSDYK